jgi:hypothetical protein
MAVAEIFDMSGMSVRLLIESKEGESPHHVALAA